MTKVLIVGGGGREHALAWTLARSPRVEHVWVAPGNPGTAAEPKCENVAAAPDDAAAQVELARARGADLIVVGPEAPLAAGIVDALSAAGLRAFGPTRAAAQLESSKAFAKQFMRECGIPTADFAVCDDVEDALEFIRDKPFRSPGFVVKADGLAAGKGVAVCDTSEQAEAAATRMLAEREFGDAGARIVIEERLRGRELSLLAFSDGRSVAVMPPARDHKRVFDHDRGPNTGGMGAYAPVPGADAALVDDAVAAVLQPAIDGMRARGTTYTGVLYAGLMLTPDGMHVLEFNCRFGDPETQAILPLLESDPLDIMDACIDGRLADVAVRWSGGACACIVLASAGYPGPYPRGLRVSISLDPHGPARIFHAGTALDSDGACVTAGGRVLSVSAVGADLSDALTKAYDGVARVRFEGMHYRTDIGRETQQDEAQ